MDSLDLESNFEPQTRARSNTWPQPRPEYYVDKDEDKVAVPATIQEQGTGDGSLGVLCGPDGVGQPPKKNSSRRNAWGNKSYADLITQAIQSSPDKRLTLSQIYDWMVQNVAYFKDKGDSNSSAGWKNSIRHNLSLHNRFMRVQNEGTGKSSWWIVNPDAKPGKAARRRAVSMETQKYEKKRGRVKKKVEALRNGISAEALASPSSSEGQDMFPDSPVHSAFQLSPDFRPRASSTASSCSRLSPIPSVDSDSQVPRLSPLPWKTELGRSGPPRGPLYRTNGKRSTPDIYSAAADKLVEEIADAMKLGNESPMSSDCAMVGSPGGAPTGQLVNGSFSLGGSTFSGFTRRSNGQDFGGYRVSSGGDSPNTPQRSPQTLIDSSNSAYMNSLSPQNPVSPSLESVYVSPYCSPQAAAAVSAPSLQQEATLRATLLGGGAATRVRDLSPSTHTTSLSSTAQLMGHILTLNNSLPNDLDLNSLDPSLECDVDQVISHELSVDGNLDFNFEPGVTVVSTSVPHSHATTMANSVVTRPWVH